MGKISGQQAQEALDKWEAYIDDYEAGLATQKTRLDTILADPSATATQKQNAQRDYELQKAHLDELQSKFAALQTQFATDGEIDDSVDFGGGKLGSFRYKTAADSDWFTGYARNLPPGSVYISAQHFSLVIEAWGTGGTWGAYDGPNQNWFGIWNEGYVSWAGYHAYDQKNYMNEVNHSGGSWSSHTFFGCEVSTSLSDDVIPANTYAALSHTFTNGIIIDMPSDTVPTESPWDYYNDNILPNLADPDDAVFADPYEPVDPDDDTPDPEDEGYPDKADIGVDEGEVPGDIAFTLDKGSMTNFCVLTPAEFKQFRATLAQTVEDSMNNTGTGSGAKNTFMYLLGKVKRDMNDITEFETAENNFIKDYIVSCRLYPFDMTYVDCQVYGGQAQPLADGNYTNIPFGFNGASITQHNLGLAGSHIMTDLVHIDVPNSNPDARLQMDYRGCTFLDFEPYSKYTMVLPFVGEVELSAHDVLCSRLYIYYVIDFTTGTCCACVCKGVAAWGDDVGYGGSVGSRTLAAKTTTIGTSMSIAGNDIVRQADQMNAAYVNQRLNRQVNALKQVEAIMPSKKQVESALKEGGFQNAFKDYALDQVLKIPQNMEMMAQIRASDLLSQVDVSQASRDVPFNLAGGSNPSVLRRISTPYLRVERASWFRPKGYAHTFGYPFEDSVAISEIDGFFQCSNPDVSGIACTEIEQKMINDALREGSYHRKVTGE